jgi:hypothetical protein
MPRNPKCPIPGPHPAHTFTIQTVATHPPGHNPRLQVTGVWCDGEAES